ncbi:MAG: DNA-protecting protein DprA [Chloroflexi bacterium]|nr:MAG: DNA-protecting protein DprA [Chloroflexota bacterium]
MTMQAFATPIKGCYACLHVISHSKVSSVSHQHQYWLGFSLVPQMGHKRIAQLYHFFEDMEKAWHATENELRNAGLPSQALDNLLTQRRVIDVEEKFAQVQACGAWILTIADEDYPSQLREIADPPAILYVKGTLTEGDKRALAIVGTRRPTQYGRDVSYRIAQKLAEQGITIISGLAQGVDAMAHLGALDGGGRTIAVLGTGIDTIYPAQHEALAKRITEHGALISEFPLGTPPDGKNFPIRNRIISGLGLGVLVTEAPERSGALTTANLALEQGREVFAVPSNIFNKQGRGTNRLIQDGAKLVMRVRDVLEELQLSYTEVETRQATKRIAPDNENEAALLNYLGADPIHIDDLIRLTGLSPQLVSSTLAILELKGIAQNVGNMQYSRVIE